MNELDVIKAFASATNQQFEKVPASKKSIHQRDLVHDVGVNDASYIIRQVVNGKSVVCPVYSRWADMIMRCYSDKFQRRCPTYAGCSVCDEWLTFSNFELWFNANYVGECHLDKDIKVIGNKVYSPYTCLLIPSELNHLLADSAAIRGAYPIGVALYKRTGRFMGSVRIDGIKKHLGYFDTAGDAHEAYKIAKDEEILRKCIQYPEFSKHLKLHMYRTHSQ